MKKAAKQFAGKFACGCSVSKAASGIDEIIIQGDFVDDVYDLIRSTWPAIPEDDITIGETKKK